MTLEERVAELELRLDTLTLAIRRGVHVGASGADVVALQSSMLAALERGELPPADALGNALHPDGHYIAVARWTRRERGPVFRGRDREVLMAPSAFVPSRTDAAEILRLQADLAAAVT